MPRPHAAFSLAAFLMVVLNVEHPPAADTALTVVVEGPSTELVLAILVSVVLLALAHRTLKPVLKDLV
jgi:CBS-domain-containing membrane protein